VLEDATPRLHAPLGATGYELLDRAGSEPQNIACRRPGGRELNRNPETECHGRSG
jgi:hypothetical protein